ncbi:polysialyltransferase family glycosyltransferase [Mesobacillus stamsii]|uniref:Uncharacterized protein n=1 Tax=Mesobacillus stamsii TaxID=225347 RepID=A0ABU0G0D4_9BACI|nr:polysialyltransferase family glycosyltransferase [Mesobacillus stamsii]MDQ0415653.1 hypothetical protein [Mesobacillus stamsii]
MLNKEKVDFNQFNKLVVFSFYHFTVWSINSCNKSNKDLTVDLVEEGLAIYITKDIKSMLSKKFRFFSDVFNIGSSRINVDRIYTYKPNLVCENDYCNVVKQLPDIKNESDTHKILEKIFQKNDYFYGGFNIVFLSQYPLIKEAEEVESKAYNLFNKYFNKDEICVKLHPSDDREHKEYKNVIKDSNMWEITVLNDDFDNKILVSINSSAALTPKLIYDKELTVILLYKLGNCINPNTDYSVFESFKNSYGNKGKLFIPESYEELVQIITGLKEKTTKSS